MWRSEDGLAHFNIDQKIIRHSPTGMEFSYSGSGPADLALNILFLYLDEETAIKYYQEFKQEFISTMPKAGGRITAHQILDFIKNEIFCSKR